MQLQRAFPFICASNMSASEGEGCLFLVHTRAARLCEILSRMICSLIHISLGWMSLHLHLHFLSQALKAWFCSFAALFWFLFTLPLLHISDFPCRLFSSYVCLMPCSDYCAALPAFPFGPSPGQCARCFCRVILQL